MSLEDEQLKNFRKRFKNDSSQIFFTSENKFIPTKASSKSIINRDNIGFKVRSCDKKQLKMILLDEGILPQHCDDPASLLIDKIPEKRILSQIENTKEIYNRLLSLEPYVLMRILCDSDVVFYLEYYYYGRLNLIESICENINYKLLDDKINSVSVVENLPILDKNSLIKSVNKSNLLNDDFKGYLLESIRDAYDYRVFSEFMASLSMDKNKSFSTTTPIKEVNIDSKNAIESTSLSKGIVQSIPKKKYVRKYTIIDNPYKKIYSMPSEKDSQNPFLKDTVIDTKTKSYNFEFSHADKKINKALYLYQQEALKEELNNEAISQMDNILNIISISDLTDENRDIIHEKILEIQAFIDKHNLTFKRVSDKQKELEKSYDDFCIKVDEKKFNNLKQNIYGVYDDLIVNKLSFEEIGNKYPNFYSYLAEDEVFNYVKRLIKTDPEFSDKFKPILDRFIKNNGSTILEMYNKVIRKLQKPIYIDEETSLIIKSEYEKAVEYLFNLNKLKEYYKNFKKNSFKTFNVESMIKKHNERFMDEKYAENKSFFDNFNGYEIDEDQRRVVLSDEKTSKIIAGAGSGKTFTLLAKMKYLLDTGKTTQDKILCISFSNASVNDLKDKIKDILGENDIDVFTFHKLGGEILKKNKEPYIPNKHLLHETIEKYFEEYIISDAKKIKKIIDFFNIHNYNSKYKKDDLNFVKIGNLRELRNSQQLTTLKGKINQLTDYEYNIKNNDSIEDVKTVDRNFVRSYEELIIANFLYVNNIDYIYEDDFFKRKNIIPEDGYTLYRPDFYLPGHDIYIEHFGVDRNLEAKHLDKLSRAEYKRSILWKREIHKKHNSDLIETFSYENQEGTLLDNLKANLEERGVEFSDVNYSRMYERLIKNDKLDDLANVVRIIENFIGLFKTNGFHIDDKGNDISETKFSEIYQEINSNEEYLKTRNKFLFEIIKDIYDLYVKQEGIDFNDMINDPIKLLNSNCKLKDYDYIFVDEYQDTSYSRYRLLKEIVDRTGAKLIVVGDDWQSIYSFSGCQIELFTNFDDYFNYSKEFIIQNNYRNSKDLINVSSKFVLENKLQLEKSLNADKITPKKAVKLAKYNYTKDFCLIFEDMIKEISHNCPDGEILILGRYNEDFRQVIFPGLFETDDFYSYEKALREQGYLKIKYLEDETVNIKFRTVHKSKGLEAENVIVIGLKYKERKGFPSKITDDSIIQYVLNKTKEDTRYAEERRLFYVALTRTKNSVYLLSHEKEPSEFIRELEKLDSENKIEFRKYRFTTDDLKRMDLLIYNKFKKRTPYDTKLRCSKCGKGDIILYKKGDGKGFFRCSACDFDFGGFNQSPELIDTLEFCGVEGCDGLTYIKEDDEIKHRICSYFGKTGCDGGRSEE